MKYLFYKEWVSSIRKLQELAMPVFFLIIIATLFQITLGSEPNILNKIAPAIIWIGVLLSISLSGENLYQNDFDDGSLEQLFLSRNSLLASVYIKLITQLILQILPIILATPVLAIFFGLDLNTLLVINLTIIIASPSLILLTMLGSAITLSIQRSGLLLVLLILPFYIPILIFSISAITNHIEGFSNLGQISILGSILLLMLSIIPITIATTIKISIAEV